MHYIDTFAKSAIFANFLAYVEMCVRVCVCMYVCVCGWLYGLVYLGFSGCVGATHQIWLNFTVLIPASAVK